LRILRFTIFSFIILLSCSREEKNNIQLTYIKLKKNIPLTDEPDCKFKYHVDIQFPLLSSGLPGFVKDNINFELNRYFFGEIINLTSDANKNFAAYISELSKSYREEVLPLIEGLSDMPEMLNYELIKSGEIIFNKKRILLIACQTYSYRGGLHGIHNIEYLHFDLNTGQLFKLDDLFGKNEKQKLLHMASAKLEEMRKKKEIVIFDESKIESIDNFYFDDDYLYFVFNPYEIGPYSEGYIKIKIDLSKIEPLLKKNIHPWF
jgi:hypothetical protein